MAENAYRDERGWVVDPGEYMNMASHTTSDSTVEVSIDSYNDICVEVDEGHIFERQQTNAYIPIDVMIRLLERAGYVVTRGATQGEVVVP